MCYPSPKMDWKNKLYFGNNLGILREHVATESVDLIYLDPRLRILTIAKFLEGKKIEFPEHRVAAFAKAERKTKAEQGTSFKG